MSKLNMPTLEEQFDAAMHRFSTADWDGAIAGLREILAQDPAHFDAQLALGMAFCRKGELERAIVEGHKAEALRPGEQLAHTNLSLFYMKAGNKAAAEHHGLQARIASWRQNPAPAAGKTNELEMARPKPPPVKVSGSPPAPAWKSKPPMGSNS